MRMMPTGIQTPNLKAPPAAFAIRGKSSAPRMIQPAGMDQVQFSGWRKPISEERFVKKFKNNIPSIWTKYINKGDIPVDLRLYKGRTLLLDALYRRALQSPEALVRLGANLNAQDDDGATPFMMAFKTDYHWQELADLMVTRDADFSLRDNDGRGPMFYAIETESTAVDKLHYLQQLGFDINEPDNEGQTVLTKAVLQGRQGLIEPLVRLGARIDVVDAKERTLMDIAKGLKNYETSQAVVYRLQNLAGAKSSISGDKPPLAAGALSDFLLEYLALAPEDRDRTFSEVCREMADDPAFVEALQRSLAKAPKHHLL